MSDENGLLKDLAGQSKGVMEKAYDDLAHPTVKSIGNTVSLIPRTIGVWLGKWEKWIINGEESIRLTAEAVREKASKIPEEKLTEPEPYVAVPAVQQLSYCYDSEKLRELYANLLVSSMNIDTKSQVHPSFVEILKQLTPDEAKLIELLPIDSMAYNPLIDVRLNMGQGRGHISLVRNYTNLGEEICEAPQNINSYIENLARLGIITILEDIHVMDGKKYEPLEKSKAIQPYLCAQAPEGQSITSHKKSFYVTPFGVNFIAVCLDKKVNNIPLIK